MVTLSVCLYFRFHSKTAAPILIKLAGTKNKTQATTITYIHVCRSAGKSWQNKEEVDRYVSFFYLDCCHLAGNLIELIQVGTISLSVLVLNVWPELATHCCSKNCYDFHRHRLCLMLERICAFLYLPLTLIFNIFDMFKKYLLPIF